VIAMIRSSFITVAAALALAVGAQSQVVVFDDVNVLPMDRNRVLERRTVVIRDGRIVEIGAAGNVTVPDGAVRVAAGGKYLMPGLAEMHGHLPSPESPRELV